MTAEVTSLATSFAQATDYWEFQVNDCSYAIFNKPLKRNAISFNLEKYCVIILEPCEATQDIFFKATSTYVLAKLNSKKGSLELNSTNKTTIFGVEVTSADTTSLSNSKFVSTSLVERQQLIDNFQWALINQSELEFKMAIKDMHETIKRYQSELPTAIEQTLLKVAQNNKKILALFK